MFYARSDWFPVPGEVVDGTVAQRALGCSDTVEEALPYIASTMVIVL